MGKWLNELRHAEEISGNRSRGYRQNRQNPSAKPSSEGFVSSVSRSSDPLTKPLGRPAAAPLFLNRDDFEERAALVEYGAGVPREWAEGFAQLDRGKPPTGLDQRRWRTLIDDGGKFLDRWGGEAAALGWSALDVFGVHPVAPGARCGAMGLVLLIDGGGVIAIDARSASIRTNLSGAALVYLRTPREGAVALWKLV